MADEWSPKAASTSSRSPFRVPYNCLRVNEDKFSALLRSSTAGFGGLLHDASRTIIQQTERCPRQFSKSLLYVRAESSPERQSSFDRTGFNTFSRHGRLAGGPKRRAKPTPPVRQKKLPILLLTGPCETIGRCFPQADLSGVISETPSNRPRCSMRSESWVSQPSIEIRASCGDRLPRRVV